VLEAAKREFSASRQPDGADARLRPLEVQQLLAAPKWDAYRFVDFCQSACQGTMIGASVEMLQRTRGVLFDYCFERCG